jgi:hypothetical protein
MAAVHVELGVIAGQQGDVRSALRHLRAVLETSEYLRDRWLLSLGARATLAVVAAEGVRRAVCASSGKPQTPCGTGDRKWTFMGD